MKIVSFIFDLNEIQKIISNLKLPNFHPPAEVKSPILDLDQDLTQDIYLDDLFFAA